MTQLTPRDYKKHKAVNNISPWNVMHHALVCDAPVACQPREFTSRARADQFILINLVLARIQ